MKARIVAAILLGLGIGVLGLVLSFVPMVQELDEDIGLGLLFRFRGERQPSSDVVIVSIERESSEQLKISDGPDRWPRSLHATMIEKLASAGAKAIVFDVHFIEAKSPSDDKLLAKAIAKAGNVVLAQPLLAKDVSTANRSQGGRLGDAGYSIVRIQKPYAPFEEAAAATAPFVLPRLPFKVNQFWTFHSGAGDAPTIPVIAFQIFAGPVYEEFAGLLRQVSPSQAAKLPVQSEVAGRKLSVGKLVRTIREILESDPNIAREMLSALAGRSSTAVETEKRRLLKSAIKLYAGSNHRYINYYGPSRTVSTIPFHQALRMGEGAGVPDKAEFRDKVVFIGLSEHLQADSKDSFYTVFAQDDGVFLSGVEIAATALLNLLEDALVEPAPEKQCWLILLLWGGVVGLAALITSAALAGMAVLGLCALYLFTAENYFASSGVWYPVVLPLFFQGTLGFLGGVLWNYLKAKRERGRIKQAFARYVPRTVVDQFARSKAGVTTGGKTVYGACLFADVAGYTTLSERMTPQALIELMNSYFEVAFEPVKKHGGLVVDLVGDSFLALWTAEKDDKAVRQRACMAAVDIATAVSRFNARYKDLELPTRIGVHCGEIFLGNVGAGDHFEYHPAGDTVNTASRMDGLNKYLGTKVLASGDTLAQVEGILTRDLGKFKLKGKAQPLVVYELLASIDQADESQERRKTLFEQGLSAFREQQWDSASTLFQEMIDGFGEDGPTRFYMKLLAAYKASPPPQPWDGVFALDEK